MASPELTSQLCEVTISLPQGAFPRFSCPHGHFDWSPHPENDEHLHCEGCRRFSERGWKVNQSHKFVQDLKTREMIPWSLVTLVEK